MSIVPTYNVYRVNFLTGSALCLVAIDMPPLVKTLSNTYHGSHTSVDCYSTLVGLPLRGVSSKKCSEKEIVYELRNMYLYITSQAIYLKNTYIAHNSKMNV